MSRRSRSGAALVALALTFAMHACGGGEGDVDGEELLSRAAERMESLESFAFVLEHENGTTLIADGLAMVRAEGRIVGTERMEAQLRALAGPVSVSVGVVVLPGGSWMTNPLTGRWAPAALSVRQFFDPATGVPAIMRGITEAQIVGTEMFGPERAYEVDAVVGSESLVGLVPRAAVGRSVRVRAWIGEGDPVLHRLEIAGAVQEGEAEDLVRRLSLSEFGAQFTIEPPS